MVSSTEASISKAKRPIYLSSDNRTLISKSRRDSLIVACLSGVGGHSLLILPYNLQLIAYTFFAISQPCSLCSILNYHYCCYYTLQKPQSWRLYANSSHLFFPRGNYIRVWKKTGTDRFQMTIFQSLFLVLHIYVRMISENLDPLILLFIWIGEKGFGFKKCLIYLNYFLFILDLYEIQRIFLNV